MIKIHIYLILLILFSYGCSWKAYDKDNQDEYYRYWQNGDNKKNSIIYPYTHEYNEEHRQKK